MTGVIAFNTRLVCRVPVTSDALNASDRMSYIISQSSRTKERGGKRGEGGREYLFNYNSYFATLVLRNFCCSKDCSAASIPFEKRKIDLCWKKEGFATLKNAPCVRGHDTIAVWPSLTPLRKRIKRQFWSLVTTWIFVEASHRIKSVILFTSSMYEKFKKFFQGKHMCVVYLLWSYLIFDHVSCCRVLVLTAWLNQGNNMLFEFSFQYHCIVSFSNKFSHSGRRLLFNKTFKLSSIEDIVLY